MHETESAYKRHLKKSSLILLAIELRAQNNITLNSWPKMQKRAKINNFSKVNLYLICNLLSFSRTMILVINHFLKNLAKMTYQYHVKMKEVILIKN